MAQWWAGSECTVVLEKPEDYDLIGKQHVITTMNHKYDIDWLMAWILAERFQMLGVSSCRRWGSSLNCWGNVRWLSFPWDLSFVRSETFESWRDMWWGWSVGGFWCSQLAILHSASPFHSRKMTGLLESIHCTVASFLWNLLFLQLQCTVLSWLLHNPTYYLALLQEVACQEVRTCCCLVERFMLWNSCEQKNRKFFIFIRLIESMICCSFRACVFSGRARRSRDGLMGVMYVLSSWGTHPPPTLTPEPPTP